jgi:hypothetical protein
MSCGSEPRIFTSARQQPVTCQQLNGTMEASIIFRFQGNESKWLQTAEKARRRSQHLRDPQDWAGLGQKHKLDREPWSERMRQAENASGNRQNL